MCIRDREIYRIAKSIEDALAQNLKIKTTIGIGTVVSCNQLTWIGEKWEGAASALNVNESAVVIYGDKTFKPLVSRGSVSYTHLCKIGLPEIA